jgi:hypothetical protein
MKTALLGDPNPFDGGVVRGAAGRLDGGTELLKGLADGLERFGDDAGGGGCVSHAGTLH